MRSDNSKESLPANLVSTQHSALSTHLFLAFAGLFLLNLLLRVFYVRYDFVNGDEGVRALTATRLLDGARMYADVVTDKPPGATLFYALVFAVFGRSMKAVHLAATVWNFGTALVVYVIGARFHNRRIGLLAALLFVYFSTNYFTQDMMAANTELLMALPYTASFCFYIVAAREKSTSLGSRPVILPLIVAGILTAMATLFKQIGVLNLGFFAIYEILRVWRDHRERSGIAWFSSIRRSIARLSLIAVGFLLVLAGMAIWLASMGALADFWRNAVVINMFYIDSEPAGLWVRFMLGRGIGYVLFNASLWSLAGWGLWRSLHRANAEERSNTEFDIAVALWCGVTLLAVLISGRFYGHYFFPALPALSLLGANGLAALIEGLRNPQRKRRTILVTSILSVVFLIGFVRCHHRTLVLAYETLAQTRTRWSSDWGMTTREEEADMVSTFVRERVPPGAPLYIWGYAHDVFWRTQCSPASRYLTPYYIDGRFADAEATVPASGDAFRRVAAKNLIEDLARNKPRLILDVEGSFKALPFPELVGFVEKHYRESGDAGPLTGRPFRMFELKDAPEGSN